MIVVDANVLLYVVGGEDPLRAPCRRLVRAQAEGRVELATTVRVLEEFAHVRSRRRSRENAALLARLFAETLTIIESTVDDFDHGLDLFQTQQGLDTFDATLAAVALRLDAEALVSADRAFADVAGLRHVDPATPALDELIAAS